MSESHQSAVLNAVDASLRQAGFGRRGRTWSRQGVETIQVVNLQSTSSGRQMFLGAGVYLRALGANSTPEEHDCHIRISAEEIATRPLVFQRALDFEHNGVPQDRRVRAVLTVLERRVLPWLDGHSTLSRARAALRRASVPAWPTPGAMRVLGLEDSAEASA